LEHISSVVLKKKLKMCQQIRGQGDHTRFLIDLKSDNTCSGPHKEHMWQVWSRSMQPFLRKSVENVSSKQRSGWPYWISDQLIK